jgi:hypothetical protein
MRKVGWPARVAAAALWSALAISTYWNAHGDDLASIAVAAHVIRTGQVEHLYDHHPELFNLVKSRVLRHAGVEIGYTSQVHPFVYPPLVAYFVAALPEVMFPTFFRISLVVAVLSLLLSLWLTLLLAAPQLKDHALVLVLPAVLIPFEPLRYALWLGQTSPLILVLCLGALECGRRNAAAPAGLLLSLAAFLKVSPAVLALVWLWRGPRRACAWLCGGVAGLAILSLLVAGADRNREYLEGVRRLAETTIAAYNNASLLAFLQRLTLPYEAAISWKLLDPLPMARLGATAAAMTFAVLSIVLLRRIPDVSGGQRRSLTEAAAMLFLLLAPSLVWTHYLLFVIPVVAIVSAIALERQRRGVVIGAVIAFACCCRPLTPDQCYADFLVHHVLAVSFPTLGLIFLSVAVLTLAGRWSPERSPEPGEK